MAATDTHRTIEAVFRIEQARLIAGLARMLRDVGLAEELAQDALVVALERWPETGIPDNPGAWLMATAKNRAIDRLRRRKRLEGKHEELARELEAEQELAVPDLEAALDDDIGDDLLSLIFTACHPVLSTEARVALTLRLLGGLTTEEIARAFLVPEPTVAQRIVRAKRTLAEAGVPFEVPRGSDRATRLSSVLEVLYLIFNEGYAATAGERLDAAAALRGGAPPRPRSRRPRRNGARGPRPGRAHGDPGVALPRQGRARGGARSCCSIRTGRCGTSSSSAAVLPRSIAPRRAWPRSARRAVPMCCRRRSPPATRAPARRRRPTGRASPRSTPRSSD